MEFDSEKFELKLSKLKDSQESITALSKWCLNKRTAHKQIVKSWLKVLKEVGIPQRLTLFYLANDVIQHSKRKSYEFVDSWATALQRASTLVRDDARVKEKISRIFNIWQQREVYTEDFISDLHGLLAINQVKKPSTSASTSITASPSSSSPIRLATQHQRSDDFDEEFQLTSVVANIRSVVSLESETDKNLKVVVKTSIPDIETVKNNLKDRSHVEDLEREVESAAAKYESFINSISSEIKARKILITALDQADKFYRNQRRDVKKVVYAYKNFGDRIKTIHTELCGKVSNLPSPMPSPDINAPSPEPDNDFDLPADTNFYNTNMNGTFGSFLNNDGQLPFDLNEFYRESPPPVDHNQSIQVIQSQDQQSTAPLNDFYSSLMPSKVESYNPAMGYGENSYRPPPPLPVQTVVATQAPMTYLCSVPPPPPPQTSNNTNQSMNSSNDEYNWNDWNVHHIETPISPPHYERKGRDDSLIEYVDENLRDLDSSINDIDHRQLFGADIEAKDVDHRNLISLTGSPGQNNIHGHRSHPPTNGNNDFIPPMMEAPQMNYMPHGDQHNMGKLGMPNFPTQIRNQRPPLLPTPPLMSQQQRYSRNISHGSDTSKGHDEMELSEVDMDLSDDDGMDNKNISGDHRDFYNMNQHPPPRFPLNRPPPPIENSNERTAWIHNNVDLQQQSDDNDLSDASSQSLLTPPNFMPHQSNRNFQRPPANNNFRGQIRNNNNNIGPYNNNSNNTNFKGNRGRGGFRGNFRGQW